MRRKSLHKAQLAMLNETQVRFTPEAFEEFVAALDAPITPLPPKMIERLSRKAPWSDASEAATPCLPHRPAPT